MPAQLNTTASPDATPQPARRLARRSLQTLTASAALALLAISCGTLTRTVLAPPDIPGECDERRVTTGKWRDTVVDKGGDVAAR